MRANARPKLWPAPSPPSLFRRRGLPEAEAAAVDTGAGAAAGSARVPASTAANSSIMESAAIWFSSSRCCASLSRPRPPGDDDDDCGTMLLLRPVGFIAFYQYPFNSFINQKCPVIEIEID